MDLPEVIEKLQRHQDWRRGSEEIEMMHPDEVGQTIDAALQYLRNHQRGWVSRVVRRRKFMGEIKVTKYPTGLLGLTYNRSLTYYSTHRLSDMLDKLNELRLSADEVEWVEHYFTVPAGHVGTEYKSKPYNYKADLT